MSHILQHISNFHDFATKLIVLFKEVPKATRAEPIPQNPTILPLGQNPDPTDLGETSPS